MQGQNAPAKVTQAGKAPQKTGPAGKTTKRPADPVAEALRVNALGVAYMNQQRIAEALGLFEQAARLDPKLGAARLNQGIALLNLQRAEQARKVLADASRGQPENPRVWYNLGLLYRGAAEMEQALAAFERAARLDANDADTQYFVGATLAQLQRYDAAVAAFERAIALNRFHASAEFGLARALQRQGQEEKAAAHLARFQRLTQERLGAPLSQGYGEQGKYSLAEQPAAARPAPSPAIPVTFVPVPPERSGVRFEAGKQDTPSSPLGAGACAFDYDNDGEPDLLFLSNSRGRPLALFRRLRWGQFEDVTAASGIRLQGIPTGCAAGDYDNDGWTDLVIAVLGERLVVYRNQGDGTFRDVAATAAVNLVAAQQGGPFFVDYDHDGDLDLVVTNTREGPQLWRNNGNGTFTETTKTLGAVKSSDWWGAASDFNNDRAVDLLLGGPEGSPAILLNPREGVFELADPWGRETPGSSVAGVTLDSDKDGWMDLALTSRETPGVSVWRNAEGKRLVPGVVSGLSGRAWGVVALDYDNDGWIDLAVSSGTGSGVRLLRNVGAQGFREVTSTVGLDSVKLADPRSLLVTDVDGDGDSELLIHQAAGSVVLLRNEGGNRNNWLKLSLRGLADNKSAIGAKVEVFAGALYQKFEVQTPNELLVGLGSAKQADIVRLVWPTGVLQDEVNLAAGKRHVIQEIDRRGSSCPIVFAWNGTRYEFIADAIGPGIVGHWVAPGQRNASDPTEYLKIDGMRLVPRDGRLRIRFVEPMEEIVYLDQLRLFAVDHPADTEVHPNEYFYASGPPFPKFKVVASRGARPPAGAWDHRGRDVLGLLRERDRRYVSGFADAPYKGFAELHWVELDLGEPAPKDTPLRLLLHGFTDYFTATSVYAAHQAGVTAVVPYVEARNAAGRWVRVVDDMGFPAGLARTMTADLTGRLPAGTRRIRILTNLKVYWDQILLDRTPEGVPVRLTEAPLAEARLRFLGYPREVRGLPASDIRYVYEEASSTGPYARAVGHYTRYGDVRALVAEAEDHFVILGSGDEVATEFDAQALPPLPAGWSRDYFLYVDGFAKDMDFYAAHGHTVEPLPRHGAERYPYPEGAGYPMRGRHLEYQLEYNTRGESGAGGRFRFQYQARRPD
jgi:Flp pilus assembly protein TadD